MSAHGSLRERKPPTAKMRKRSAAVRQERAAARADVISSQPSKSYRRAAQRRCAPLQPD